MKRWMTSCLCGFAILVLAGCSAAESEPVLVMAASSLGTAFEEMEMTFEEANPSIDVQLNLAGSSSLREQLLDGAQADVFASANAQTMQQVVAELGSANEPALFATNELALVVPTGNPGDVRDLQDLARGDLFVGLCAIEVPCGSFAREALAQVDVEPAVDTNEPNVRALFAKVAAGELDVGIVYASDAVANPTDVERLALPESIDVDIVYPIVELRDTPNSAGASAFVAFVLAPEGRSILAAHGFGSP